MLAFVLLFLLAGQARAMETDEILQSQAGALDLDDLQRAAEEYAPDMDWTQTPDLNSGLSDLLETGTESLHGVVKKALRSGLLLLAIVLLSSLAESAAACGTGKTIRAAPVAAALAITAVAVADANTLIGLGSEVIEKMELFSKVLLPTIAAATAASGSPGGAAARQLAAMLFSDLLMSLINRLLLPLVYAYIAACTAYAAIGNEGLKRIAATLKWVVTSILTTVLLAFVGYLTVSGVIAGSTDALTIKAAKFTVSSMVPVVGGILSDASETVLAGASILKNSVGVFGMLVVLGMCIVPFLQLGVHYLMYKITAALSATVADSRTAGLIDGISGAFGLVLGMTGACALLLLVSLVSAVTVVSP
ncbi:MAG: stage III sporulation protein AE [Oscillospiraceae bacterium]